MRCFCVVLFALFAALAAFATVAQCESIGDGRLACITDKVTVVKTGMTSESTKLKVGDPKSPFFTATVQLGDKKDGNFFLFSSKIGVCRLGKVKEMPTDPSKLHYVRYIGGPRESAVVKEKGEVFVLHLGGNKYVGVETLDIAFSSKPRFYLDFKVINGRGGPRKIAVDSDRPAPPKVESVSLATYWWPNCYPEDFGLEFAEDTSNRQYKVPMGTEIPVGNTFLLFEKDSVAFRSYSKLINPMGMAVAYSKPLAIDRIPDSGAVKEYEYQQFVQYQQKAGMYLAETRVPLVLGQGRLHALDKERVAVEPVAIEGSDMVFNMRLFVTDESRELIAKAVKEAANRKAGVIAGIVAPDRQFYLKGFNYTWGLAGSKARLHYEATVKSVESLECAVVPQTLLSKIKNPVDLKLHYEACESRLFAGENTVDFGDIVLLRVNGKFYVGLSATGLKDGGAVNGEEKKNIACDYKFWQPKTADTIARADTASTR